MNPLLIRRRGMMQAAQGGIPYDSKVKYIGANGTQYIDTGIAANANSYKLETRIAITENANSSAGIMSVYDNGRIYLLDRTSNNYCCGKTDGTWNINNVAHVKYGALNTYMDIECIMDNASATIKVGSTTNSVSVSTLRTSTKHFLIFKRNDTALRPFYGNIQYLKLTLDGVLVRDYIPVRVGQVGYMYDRVSSQLFGNAGTGDFILGPDIQ